MNKICTFLFTLLLLMSLSGKAQPKNVNEGRIEMQVSAVDKTTNCSFTLLLAEDSLNAQPSFA